MKRWIWILFVFFLLSTELLTPGGFYIIFFDEIDGPSRLFLARGTIESAAVADGDPFNRS
jgi:membrane protein implicated in regulation of membrane protease activity